MYPSDLNILADLSPREKESSRLNRHVSPRRGEDKSILELHCHVLLLNFKEMQYLDQEIFQNGQIVTC